MKLFFALLLYFPLHRARVFHFIVGKFISILNYKNKTEEKKKEKSYDDINTNVSDYDE